MKYIQFFIKYIWKKNNQEFFFPLTPFVSNDMYILFQMNSFFYINWFLFQVYGSKINSPHFPHLLLKKIKIFFCLEANWRGFHRTCQRKFILAHISKKNKKKLPCVVVFNFQFNEEWKDKIQSPLRKKNILKEKKSWIKSW